MQVILFTTSDMAGARTDKLLHLLRGLASESDPPHHFLLLQGVGTDEMQRVRAAASPRTRITRVPHRLSISRARNLLLASAFAESALESDAIAGFPDDDAFYPPMFLQSLRRLFAHEPSLDMLVCNSDPQPDERLDETLMMPAPMRELVRGATSNTFFVRSGLLRRLGAFDEALGLGTPARGGEDTEFVLRAALMGRRSLMSPQALVGHPAKTLESVAYYYAGAAVAIGLHARRRPAVAVEFVRKLAVGGWHVLHGRLSARSALVAWRQALAASMRRSDAMLPAGAIPPLTTPSVGTDVPVRSRRRSS